MLLEPQSKDVVPPDQHFSNVSKHTNPPRSLFKSKFGFSRSSVGPARSNKTSPGLTSSKVMLMLLVPKVVSFQT